MQSAMPKRDEKTTSDEGSPMAKARWRVTRGMKTSLHKVWDLWSIRRIPMKEKKWKQQLETACDPLEYQKSGTRASRQEIVPVAAGSSMQKDQLKTHSDERKHVNSNGTRRLDASTP